MNTIFLIAFSFLSAAPTASASEQLYYLCQSNHKEFENVTIKQVIDVSGSEITSTFRLDSISNSGEVSYFWQAGDVVISTGEVEFEGPFAKGEREIQVAIKLPHGEISEAGRPTLTLGCQRLWH